MSDMKDIQGQRDYRQINIKKVDFESKSIFGSLFMPPNLFWLILSLVGGFMMVMVGLFFLDPLKKIVTEYKAKVEKQEAVV